METLTLTDLFFWLTGIAVIIVTTLAVIALLYLILFIRTIKNIARQAQKAGEMMTEDFVSLRNNIKDKGFSFKSLITFLFGIKAKQNKKRKSS